MMLSDERIVEVAAGPLALDGTLGIPAAAHAVVVLPVVGGSGRHSERDQLAARRLRRAGIATLVVSLFGDDEVTEDELTRKLRYDLELLARRLVGATEWLAEEPAVARLPIGYLGAGTGAAAALAAAAALPRRVGAVVARGGELELAADVLPRVAVPTLLVVAEHDPLLRANRDAVPLLRGERRLVVLPGASHAFDETGALEEATRLAIEWFEQHLDGGRAAART